MMPLHKNLYSVVTGWSGRGNSVQNQKLQPKCDEIKFNSSSDTVKVCGKHAQQPPAK